VQLPIVKDSTFPDVNLGSAGAAERTARGPSAAVGGPIANTLSPMPELIPRIAEPLRLQRRPAPEPSVVALWPGVGGREKTGIFVAGACGSGGFALVIGSIFCQLSAPVGRESLVRGVFYRKGSDIGEDRRRYLLYIDSLIPISCRWFWLGHKMRYGC
jgi:hypothetical protein